MESREIQPASTAVEQEKSPEEKRAEFLILDIQKFGFSSGGEGQTRYRDAKQEILGMGDAGVDLITRAVKEQKLLLYYAIELLGESSSEKSLSALESFLTSDVVPNAMDSSAASLLLMKLSERDKPSSIPAIVKFVEYRLEKANEVLGEKDATIEQLGDRGFLFALSDVRQAINGLQKFTDREGFRQAERLYENFNQIKSGVDAVRTSERARLKEFLDKPYEVNLEDFPGASPEEAERINETIAEMQNNPTWWDEHASLGRFGEQAVPFIYQAIKEGRLTGQRAWRTLAQYPPRKMLPIYHGLLLECAQSNVTFFQHDILQILKNSKSSESVKIVAEFIRKSAELSLAIEEEEKRFTLQNNVRTGIRILNQFGTDEAEKLKKLLSFSYPELSAGYEVISVPKLERPKTKEQREWAHTKMYIRGSALFAALLGRGKEKVHDVDIFITNSDHYATAESTKVGYLESVNDLENILSKEEFAKLKAWIDQNGYAGKPINVVRVPESHLELEESFEGEPKLLLWDQALEGEIESNRYAAEDLQSYKEGKRIINPQFPARLIPNGTLTRALRLMDLAERLGFEYDETMLNQAEQAARNSKLIISSIPANRLVDRHELSPTVVLDPTFVKVFEDKKLRKPLLRKFPRLGQLAEEIGKAGGIEQYIKEKYGEVYLRTNGYVRLYDIDLSKSPASLERQKQFVQEWYAELRLKDLVLASVEKLTDITALPKPERLEELIDSQKMQSAIEQRKSKNTFLDKVAGRFKVALESTDPYELKRKIELFLSVMNIDWPANMEMDRRRVSQTLIRLGIHPKNPILSQFDSTKRHEVELVISAEPTDILQASTDKPWHSCTCIKGSGRCEGYAENIHYPHSLYEDVGGATVVAYLVKNENFIARMLVRAGFTLDNFEPAAAIEKLYGDQRYQRAMSEAIKKIVTGAGVKTGAPMMTYPFGKEAYFDSAEGLTSVGNRYYYSRQHAYA